MADLNVAPLKIVGVEGLFGSIIMLGAVLPIVQLLPGKDGKGLHEDSVDTWHVRGPCSKHAVPVQECWLAARAGNCLAAPVLPASVGLLFLVL